MWGGMALLVLLFSTCGALALSTQTEDQPESQNIGAAAAAAADVSTQLDVSAELKELRDMVVELRVTLKYTQDELKVMGAENVLVKERLVASETKVEALEIAKDEMKTEVEALERVLQDTKAEMKSEVDNLQTMLQDTKAEMMTEVENLKRENAVIKTIVEVLKNDNAAQKQELANLKTRLATYETKIDDLELENVAHEKEVTALQSRLAASEIEIDGLKGENGVQRAELTALQSRMAETETDVENLEKTIQAAPKVAFSAGLTNSGHIQSGDNDLNLVFSKIITNVGQSYSSGSGFFTAPVKGVYYFRFTVMDFLDMRRMTIRICKNGQQLMRLNEYDTDGQNNYLSSGVTLELEVGDEVNMVLPSGFRLYDSTNNHSIFSGFLLFSL